MITATIKLEEGKASECETCPCGNECGKRNIKCNDSIAKLLGVYDCSEVKMELISVKENG